MGESGLDRTDNFQKFCRSVLDRIPYLWIRVGLGLKIFTIRSSWGLCSIDFVSVGKYLKKMKNTPAAAKNKKRLRV